jgi:hypothetical protein
MHEFKRCYENSNRLEKNNCGRNLYFQTKNLSYDNPVRDEFLNYTVDIWEITSKYSNNEINETQLKSGMTDIGNRLSDQLDNRARQERIKDMQTKQDGAVLGSVACLAFAKNATACATGALEASNDDDDRLSKLHKLQQRNAERIRQLEESQQRLLNETKKIDINQHIKNCSPSGRFC